MSNLPNPRYFTCAIIDLNCLKDQTLESILENMDKPDYLLLANTWRIDKRVLRLPPEYQIQNFDKYSIASIRASDIYTSPAKIEPVRITKEQYGLTLSLQEINILYMPLNKCSNDEVNKIFNGIRQLQPSKSILHMICLQTNKPIKGMSKINNWTYHKLNHKQFCLRYNINFHILVNNEPKPIFAHPKIDLNILTQDLSYETNNYGLLINLPCWIVNFLDSCYHKEPISEIRS